MLEALWGEGVVEVELEPARGHDAELDVGFGNVAFAVALVEAEIVGEIEDGEVARSVGAVAGLEGVVEAEAKGVGGVEIVDVASIAEAEGAEVGGEGLAVDLRDEASAVLGLRNVAVGEPRGDEVSEPVDVPAFVLILVGGAGVEFGVDAEFAEPAVIVVFAGARRGAVVVGDAAAGDGGDAEPFLRGKGAAECVVGIDAPALEGGGGAVRVVLAEDGGAALEALIEAGGKCEGEKVETQLGEAFLDGVVGVGLDAREEGDLVVGAGVGGFQVAVGRLRLVEGVGAEIAEDFGVAPVVEEAVEGEVFVEALVVLPGEETAVGVDGFTEDVDVAVAGVVDVAGADLAEDFLIGAGIAAVGGGGADEDAAFGVEAEVAAEFHARGHGDAGTEVEVGAEVIAEARAKGEERPEWVFHGLVEAGQRDEFCVLHTDAGVLGAEALVEIIGEAFRGEGGGPRAGLAERHGGVVDRELLLGAFG